MNVIRDELSFLCIYQGLADSESPASGTRDDDDDRDDEHDRENEAAVAAVDETTEAPEEFEAKDEDDGSTADGDDQYEKNDNADD
jgi:hypothetical protein